MVIVLAVDVDQMFGNLPEHGKRDGVAVEGYGAAAGGVQLAGQKNFTGVGGDTDIGCFLDFLQRVVAFDFKDPADAPLVCPRAKHLRRIAQAKKHFNRPNDKAFAGAGRACKAVQTRSKLDACIGDDGEIGDVQFAEHLDGESVVRCQLSVVGCRLSVVGCRLSGRKTSASDVSQLPLLATDNGPLTTDIY